MVNVTMLVHNRLKLTQQALATIGHVDNLTILDDASDSETADWLIGYRGPSYLVMRNAESRGTAAARNEVINASAVTWGRGDFLYLSDNDVYFLDPYWLDYLVGCLLDAERHGFRVLGAYNHPYHQQKVTEVAGVREVDALALQSMLMRWDVWQEFGPFGSTRPGHVCDGEDVLFGNSVKASGGRLGVVSPPLLVNTGVTNSFGQPIPGADLVRAEASQYKGVYIE